MGIEVTVQEGEIFCEYLVGDVRRLKQIWARLLKKAYINARPGCRIFTGYRVRNFDLTDSGAVKKLISAASGSGKFFLMPSSPA